MIILILGLIIFLGSHSIRIFASDWRDSMISSKSEAAWKGMFSLVALVGFVLIIYGYGQARLDPIVIYSPPSWLRHVTMLLMLPVFAIFIATYVPSRIKTTLKHPTLVAVKLWALAHLLANGMLADILLFGGFLAWAVADRISIKRRQRASGNAGSSTQQTPAAMNDAIIIVAGLVIFAIFVVWGHGWLIGMPLISR